MLVSWSRTWGQTYHIPKLPEALLFFILDKSCMVKTEITGCSSQPWKSKRSLGGPYLQVTDRKNTRSEWNVLGNVSTSSFLSSWKCIFPEDLTWNNLQADSCLLNSIHFIGKGDATGRKLISKHQQSQLTWKIWSSFSDLLPYGYVADN